MKEGTSDGEEKIRRQTPRWIGQREAAPQAYEKQLRKQHVEQVKLQQWVTHKGLKVCVVLEGRDGAGKGGAIKAISERVSPRIFRVVALPAPTEREKSQMYVQRYVPRRRRDRDLRPQLVQPRGRGAGDGLLHPEQLRGFYKAVPAVEMARSARV